MVAEVVRSSEANGGEREFYAPRPEVVQGAYVKDWDALAKRAGEDPVGFWEERARELEWYAPWTQVLDDSNKPFYKWFSGAKVNIVHNCLDRYMNSYRKNMLALIWEGENGDTRTFSYRDPGREVRRFANVLKSMGVRKATASRSTWGGCRSR